MSPIDKNDFFPIGSIVKPHGLKGDMILEVEEGFDEVLEDSAYLLVEVEGGLVPFFISEAGINFRTATSISLAFDDLDSPEKVRLYCGCQIFLHKDAEMEDSIEEFNELMGVMVFDKERGKLGEISRVDDFSGNVVLTIQYGPHEVLIPLSEELIVRYDLEQKELCLDCPDGLIDLYLEG